MRALRQLFFAHIDAWCVALIAAAAPLYIHDAFTPRTLYLLFSISGVYWLAFALNDYFDADHDATDPVKAQRNYFVAHPMSSRQLMLAYALVGILFFPAAAQFSWRGWLLGLIGGGIMWAYSAPPLRLKSRPILDLISHTLFVETFPYWSILFLLNLDWLPLDYTLLTVALLSSFTAQLEQQARDYAVDSATDRNFTTTFGLATNLLLMRLATAILIVFGVWRLLDGTIPMLFAPLGILPQPVLWYRFVRREFRPKSQRLAYTLAAISAIYMLGLIIFLSV